jgi:hypothetical protein
MAHHGRYPRIVISNYHKCKNCGEHGDLYVYPDGAPAGRLCAKHAAKHGFCIRCGHFCAGIEDFDFSPVSGMCGDCADEFRCDLAEEEDFDDDYFRDENDEYDDLEDALQECGKVPAAAGGCLNAGTEYCDFDCPFRDEEDDDA